MNGAAVLVIVAFLLIMALGIIVYFDVNEVKKRVRKMQEEQRSSPFFQNPDEFWKTLDREITEYAAKRYHLQEGQGRSEQIPDAAEYIKDWKGSGTSLAGSGRNIEQSTSEKQRPSD